MYRRFVLSPSALFVFLLLTVALIPLYATRAQATSRYFPETQHYLKGLFLKYWNEHGGLAQQGYPLTEEFQERSQLNGKVYTVQYFERAVFEFHPENAGTPYDVLLSQIGKYQLDVRYPNGNEATTPVASPGIPPTVTLTPNAPTALPTPSEAAGLPIYVGENLSGGYDMGVDTSGHQYAWVTNLHGAMKLNYPPGQDWGAVFITVGKPVPPGERQSRDFSHYQTLAVDLRGEQGGERLRIGIKDKNNSDDGKEIKADVTLTAEWQTYRFPLAYFVTADLAHLYVPIEFVFDSGVGAETVYFRNVWYLAAP
jgi:hypothetical protein